MALLSSWFSCMDGYLTRMTHPARTAADGPGVQGIVPTLQLLLGDFSQLVSYSTAQPMIYIARDSGFQNMLNWMPLRRVTPLAILA